MRLALMIEGQECVSWEDWLALAQTREEHGVEALFRSDHYLSQTEPGVMLQHLDHRELELVALIGAELAPAVA